MQRATLASSAVCAVYAVARGAAAASGSAPLFSHHLFFGFGNLNFEGKLTHLKIFRRSANP
jgi:hypothetical protein